MTQLNPASERHFHSNTHCVAYSVQDNRLVACCHLHQTIAQAAACIEGAGGCVKAFTDGQERPLSRYEQDKLIAELLTLLQEQKELARKDDLTGSAEPPGVESDPLQGDSPLSE